ncbi:DarT ssDNA thymidine ADP-ribosyltransferase family protein [Pedobacter lithocola]|uniref:DarT ssDNA thymidine ADP-ribosyltransferase family protein n=1 Tax=Pedobacter lithocola TaxID=1908239 RepID=A0ABV8PHL5_9SPHI
MAGSIPNPLWLYRIIHCDNLEYILKNGIYVRGHKNQDPNYVNIGNLDIINVRDNFEVKLDGYVDKSE